MSKEEFSIFSDASYSKKHKLGVAGFLIINNANNHAAFKISSSKVQTTVFKEENNIRVELRGVIWALESFMADQKHDSIGSSVNISHLSIYIDCKSVLSLLDRRTKLEASNYISKRSKRILSNADLYKRFFVLYDDIKPNIIWVKGHSAKRERTFVQNNFSYIDMIVRKELRAICA